MKKFRLNKLVRDKIVDFHKQTGGDAEFKVLEAQEYLAALRDKIIEEANELKLDEKQKLVAELADIQEVVDTMVKAIGKTKKDVKLAQLEKRKSAGAFKKKHYIYTVTLPDSDKWTKYYESQPDRFTEVKGEIL
jgi:predicted house-cleaning noncanonical NTP pyrophosphatase (MazG superfamily)